MISNNSQENSSIGTGIPVPPLNPTPDNQLIQQPTLYDYLALFPVLITAVTPLILGLKNKINQDKNKSDNDK